MNNKCQISTYLVNVERSGALVRYQKFPPERGADETLRLVRLTLWKYIIL